MTLSRRVASGMIKATWAGQGRGNLVKLRTFLAIEAGALQDEVVQLMRHFHGRDRGVKWVRPDQLHLTLKFFGDIQAEEVYPISQAMARVAAAHAPFALELSGLGAFPHAHKPRTLWVGVSGGAAAIESLQGDLDRAFRALGYPPEARRFRGHFTLGRVRGAVADLELVRQLTELATYEFGTLPVEELVLFSSQLGATGPMYSPLTRCDLTGT